MTRKPALDLVPLAVDTYVYEDFTISVLHGDDGPVYACSCDSDTGTCEHREWFIGSGRASIDGSEGSAQTAN